MKLVSWNVNGLRSVARNGYWLPFLKGTKPDVICLQEVKAEPDQLPEEVREVGGFSSFFSPCQIKKGYSGVALYSRIEPLSVIYGMGTKEFDQEGRLVGAEYEDFWLLNIYFPNGGRGPERLDFKLRYYEAFLAFCEGLRKNKPVIFCGDVNTAHFPIDLARPKENSNNTGFLPIERKWLDEVVAAGYIDIFRSFYPNQKDIYSYWDNFTHARERNVGWRIDYFFAVEEFLKHIKSAAIHTDIFGSDHCPVSITLK
ncbi:MAG TPA: exodeoxyribonuclease III [Candidatus Paceibacterota bacterium]